MNLITAKVLYKAINDIKETIWGVKGNTYSVKGYKDSIIKDLIKDLNDLEEDVEKLK
jgi:hypothetical protein